MEIKKQELKQILTKQRKEYEHYLGALKEDFDSKVEVIGEQYFDIKKTLALHTGILNEHTETLALHTGILNEHTETLALHTEILKQKVDTEGFGTHVRKEGFFT